MFAVRGSFSLRCDAAGAEQYVDGSNNPQITIDLPTPSSRMLTQKLSSETLSGLGLRIRPSRVLALVKLFVLGLQIPPRLHNFLVEV